MVTWAVLEQVYDGHLGSAGASVQWSPGQCWSKCTMVTWAVLEQVYNGHLGSAGASVRWSSGQCWSKCTMVTRAVSQGHTSVVPVFIWSVEEVVIHVLLCPFVV